MFHAFCLGVPGHSHLNIKTGIKYFLGDEIGRVCPTTFQSLLDTVITLTNRSREACWLAACPDAISSRNAWEASVLLRLLPNTNCSCSTELTWVGSG